MCKTSTILDLHINNFYYKYCTHFIRLNYSLHFKVKQSKLTNDILQRLFHLEKILEDFLFLCLNEVECLNESLNQLIQFLKYLSKNRFL